MTSSVRRTSFLCRICLEATCSKFLSPASSESLVVLGLLLEPLLEVLELSATVVIDGCVLGTLRVELEGGVSSDIDSIDLVGGGVHLGDGEASHVLEVSSELVPDGGELLAVAAPWGVELDEDIVVVVGNDLLEVLPDDDLDRLRVVGGDLFGLEEGGQLAIGEVVDELGDRLDGDALGLAFEGELLHVVCGVEDADGGEVGLCNTDELTESLLDALSDT